jgi:hypothetical protein
MPNPINISQLTSLVSVCIVGCQLYTSCCALPCSYCCESCLVSVMLRALTRRLLYTEDLLGIDLQEGSIKPFLRWDYFLKVTIRMALPFFKPFVFTLPADSAFTASAYVLMVGSETFLSVDNKRKRTTISD